MNWPSLTENIPRDRTYGTKADRVGRDTSILAVYLKDSTKSLRTIVIQMPELPSENATSQPAIAAEGSSNLARTLEISPPRKRVVSTKWLPWVNM
jgi:hypothetical protein